MVILQVKKGDQNLFLYETTTAHHIADLVDTFVYIHNGQLKIERLCYGKTVLRFFSPTNDPMAKIFSTKFVIKYINFKSSSGIRSSSVF